MDQGKAYQTQAYNIFDLWQKDASTNRWGKSVGMMQGTIRQVEIGPHQTKVWKAIPAPIEQRSEL
jgi:alpha-galactosidase